MRKIVVVVPNWNGAAELPACLDSLRRQTLKPHVIVVDNGSVDDSLELLQTKYPWVEVMSLPENLGFAGGVNVGIQKAMAGGAECIALLNNDARVAKDWLKILANTLRKTGASVATGLLLDSSGKIIESTGDGCSSWGLPYPRQRGQPAGEAYESGFVFGGTAGASVYKAVLFKDIGLFDEKFFAYYEDTDISFRAQLAGHKTYYEKTALGYHDHGTTSSKIPGFTVYQTFKNLPMFFWKNWPWPVLFQTGIRFFICYGSMYARAVMRGQFVIATKGLLRGLTLFPYALRQRRRVQRRRRVPATYLKTIIYQGLSPNTTAWQSLRRKLGVGHG